MEKTGTEKNKNTSLSSILTQWYAFMTMSMSSTCPLVKDSRTGQLTFAVLYLLVPSAAFCKKNK